MNTFENPFIQKTQDNSDTQKDRYQRLQAASLATRKISQEVNAEFAAFEEDNFD